MKAPAQSHILVAGRCQDLQPGRCGSGTGAQSLRPCQAIGCRLEALPARPLGLDLFPRGGEPCCFLGRTLSPRAAPASVTLAAPTLSFSIILLSWGA